DKQRLSGAHDVLDQMVAGRARAFRQPLAVNHFHFEADLACARMIEGDEKAADVQHAAHFRINAAQQRTKVERGAERAANVVQDVQLFAAARGLLDQVAVLDGSADLLAQREQQAPLGRSETAVIRSAEQQRAEDALLSLQADADHLTQTLREQHAADLQKRFLLFEGFPIRVTREVAKYYQAAEARIQIHHIPC